MIERDEEEKEFVERIGLCVCCNDTDKKVKTSVFYDIHGKKFLLCNKCYGVVKES